MFWLVNPPGNQPVFRCNMWVLPWAFGRRCRCFFTPVVVDPSMKWLEWWSWRDENIYNYVKMVKEPDWHIWIRMFVWHIESTNCTCLGTWKYDSFICIFGASLTSNRSEQVVQSLPCTFVTGFVAGHLLYLGLQVQGSSVFQQPFSKKLEVKLKLARFDLKLARCFGCSWYISRCMMQASCLMVLKKI